MAIATIANGKYECATGTKTEILAEIASHTVDPCDVVAAFVDSSDYTIIYKKHIAY